jgi:hypothetical protein
MRRGGFGWCCTADSVLKVVQEENGRRLAKTRDQRLETREAGGRERRRGWRVSDCAERTVDCSLITETRRGS